MDPPHSSRTWWMSEWHTPQKAMSIRTSWARGSRRSIVSGPRGAVLDGAAYEGVFIVVARCDFRSAGVLSLSAFREASQSDNIPRCETRPETSRGARRVPRLGGLRGGLAPQLPHRQRAHVAGDRRVPRER